MKREEVIASQLVPLQYITTDPNGSYISTGVILGRDTNNVEMEFKIRYYPNLSTSQMLIHSYDPNLTTDKSPIQIYTYRSNSRIYNHASYVSWSQIVNQFGVVKTYTTAQYRKITIGSATNTSYAAATPINTGTEIYLFCSAPQAIAGTVTNSLVIDCQCIKIKVNGTLVRDYIPKLNKVTNIAGLFDNVEGTFSTSEGPAQFGYTF